MSMNHKISVIIPFYKTPILRLRICIERFLNQSYPYFELLLIDDGNGSEYDYIKEQYAALDDRIHFIQQPNAGVSSARNTGLRNATGDYIVFSDSDDYVDCDFLYKLLRAIDGFDLAICGVTEQWYPSINAKVDMRMFCSTPSQYNWLQYVNFSVNKILKKEIIDANQLEFDPDVKLGEDALFLARYFKYCKRIQCIADNLYHYVPNEESAVHTYYPKYWDWEQEVISEQYKLFTRYPLSSHEQKFMQRWLYLKVKGALYYYLCNETENKIRENKIHQILSSPYYQLILKDFEKNTLFSKIDFSILTAWKMLGEKGVLLSNWISTHR